MICSDDKGVYGRNQHFSSLLKENQKVYREITTISPDICTVFTSMKEFFLTRMNI